MTQLKILLAEDDAVITLILHELVAKLGHRVIAAVKTGIEAVEMTKESEPDLIIMDIKMPGLDGLEAATVIMDEFPTPIVILTAHSEESFVERASKAGISTYLVKPISEANLRPALKLAVDRFCEQQTLAEEASRTRERFERYIVVDRAKWLLINECGYSEEKAHRTLQQISRDLNTRLDETAKSIISRNISLVRNVT